MLIGGPTHTYVVDSGIMGVFLVTTLVLEVPENQQTAGVGYQYLHIHKFRGVVLHTYVSKHTGVSTVRST